MNPSILTIGVFDGVHLGHQYIFQELIKKAEQGGLQAVILTFDHAQLLSLHSTKKEQEIYSTEQKLAIIKNLNLKPKPKVVVLDFLAIKDLSPAEFIVYLQENFNFKKLLVGHDFAFGKKRIGNTQWLLENQKKYAFEVEILPKIQVAGEEISSTLIKDYLEKQEYAKAEELLGREVFL